jgi:phospholipid-binding lipoprotein MlaA
VAVAYKTVTPRLVRAGVTNFFNNLGDTWSLANNILQGKLQASVETYFRLTVNTIWGMGGVFDVATEIGVESHTEDFGQTLGLWGIPTGPYLVLPFFGPSSLRDALATPADTFGYPVTLVNPVSLRNSLAALNAVDKRANYLRAGEMLDESALDKYAFSRDFFLQKRRNDIYDGSPPLDEEPPEPDANGEALKVAFVQLRLPGSPSETRTAALHPRVMNTGIPMNRRHLLASALASALGHAAGPRR